MASVLAIISRAIFDKAAGKLAAVGDVVPLDRYTSKNKGLTPVAGGGALFLVTVRPPDEALWLVTVLESPTFDGENWIAATNTMPIRDISGLKDQVKFVSGTGISAKKGALGMSLQTPRVLTDEDVGLLRAGASGAPVTPLLKGANGHLNGHERGGPTPCLCHRCIGSAPETFKVGSLDLVRREARTAERFLWYWVTTSLLDDEPAIRRAVESRLRAREPAPGQAREHDDLDTVFAGDEDDE
jgi:hypothetical protein